MKRFSLFLSYAFCILGFVLIALLTVAVPQCKLSFVGFCAEDYSYLWLVLSCSYVILALMAVANVCLLLLLNKVRTDAIFTNASVRLLNIISWASILAAIVAIPTCFFMHAGIAIVFIALFLGLVIRIIKQVIGRGTMLKNEYDSTI